MQQKEFKIIQQWLKDSFMDKAEILAFEIKSVFGNNELKSGELILGYKDLELYIDIRGGFRYQAFILDTEDPLEVFGTQLSQIFSNGKNG